jgi:phage terminase large subunit-like protein
MEALEEIDRELLALKGFSLSDEEALAKDLCEHSLYDFVKEAWGEVEQVPLIPSWHIEAICEHLQAVTLGQIPKLLINIPPGCSKSLLCAVFWPVWEWARDASVRWFFASYDQRLSTRDSVKCRSLIDSRWFQKLWGDRFHLVYDSNQKTFYETDKRGYRLATSVKGHGTGEHPDRIVIDDAHSVQQAESEVESQSVLDWYDQTMTTRGVSREARRVVVGQRLKPRDLPGHLLAKGDWVPLILPMRYEPERMPDTPLGWNDPRGDPGKCPKHLAQEQFALLTPEQFNEPKVKEMEKNLGEYGTAGQLQQRPQPRSGGMFKEIYFVQRVKAAPYKARRVRFWDKAATADGGCYSAGVLLALGDDECIYVEHCVHGQWEPDDRNSMMLSTAQRDRARYGPQYEPMIWCEREGGASGKDSFKFIAKRLKGFSVRELNVSGLGSKDVRAEPWSSACAAGIVKIVDNGESEGFGRAEWDVNGFIQEHVLFRPQPGKRLGKYCDQVDSASGGYVILANPSKYGVGFRVLGPTRKKGEEGFKICVCTFEELALLEVDHKCLLCLARDPGEDSEPSHALDKLIDRPLSLIFPDLEPPDLQESWDEVIQPYGKKASEILITRDEAKKFWSWFLRKRQDSCEVLVIASPSGRRAYSCACAVADMLRMERKKAIHVVGLQEGDPPPPVNQHVLATMKAGRAMVM